MNPMPHEETLFQAALPLAGAERAAFLDRECAGDPALRARLEALLAAHDQTDTLFGTQAGAARPTISLDLAHELPDDLVGQTIGRYKLLEKIGEGGCGVVYVAEQTEPVRRRVALKIIKLGMDTKQVVARFEAERQALAMMDHPNIAKVLDAGTTDGGKSEIRSPRSEANPKSEIRNHESPAHPGPWDASEAARAAASPLPSDGRGVGGEGLPASPSPPRDSSWSSSRIPTGRPYFVMELVRGIKITDYCDQERLSTRDRLDLFIKVCHAIQHAHQKGIIHRDIKPSNILVTLHDGIPVPKVIDFGIAKAVEGRLTDATVYTQLHQFIGTPAYMSPEQAEMTGLDIDTRSDIYSLGVLLYELLTGTTPFDAKELMSQGIDAMRRTIREQEPPRPSARLTQALAREVGRGAPRAPALVVTESGGGARGATRPTSSEEEGSADSRRRLRIQETLALLRGDLDWVVMKCLEKDRGRRYETANGLAADLQRHLDNEPVAARPPSAVYRLQKLFRRHKLAFTAGVAVALALVGGLGVSRWQAREASRAREAADLLRVSETEQRLRAGAAQKQAETERARTQSALDRETTALAEATRANQALETALSKEQRSAYARGIALARQEWLSDQVARADRTLMETGPEELRGFEWHYLRGLCQGRGAERFKGRLGGQNMFVPASGSGASHLVTMPEDTGMVVLDAATREEIFRPAPGSSLTNWSTLALSPEGDVLAVAEGTEFSLGGGSRIILLDRRSQHQLGAIAVPPLRAIKALAFSPDGRLVAAGLSFVVTNSLGTGWSEAGGYVAWWSVASGELQHSTPASTTKDWTVAFTPDGSWIVGAGQTGPLDVWETATGDHDRTIPPGAGWTSENLWVLSPDGQQVAMRAEPGMGVRFVDVRTGAETLGYVGHPAPITAVAYSQDGRWFAVGSSSGSVRVWDIATSQQLALFRHPWSVSAVGFSADGRGLFVGNSGTSSGQAEYLRWDWAAYQDPRELRHHNRQVWTTTFSPDMQVLASSSDDGEVVLWDLVNNRPSATLRGHPGGVCGVALSPVEYRVATGGRDGAVRIWDGCSGELLHSASDHGNWVSTVAYSPDGALVASASGDATVKVRNGHTAEVVYEFLGHKSAGSRGSRQAATTVVFSPDGREIASAGYDGWVRVWGATTGEERLVLEHEDRVYCVAYRPDGRVLATCAVKGGVKLWDAESGEEILTLKGTLGGVKAVAFTPDGQRIAATSAGTVWIFDAVSGLELLALQGGDNGVAFSPDGRFLAAGGSDGVVRLWDGTPSVLDAQLRAFHEVLQAPGLAHQTRVRTLLKRSELLQRAGSSAAARQEFLEASIFPRDPQTAPNLIDLSAHYNAALGEVWYAGGISLDGLPTGRQRFAGVDFDVRGLIQVGAGRPIASGLDDAYAHRTQAIRIGRRCDRLHFLHAAINAHSTAYGVTIGTYTLRYANGRKAELPIRVGIEVADWSNQPDEDGKSLTTAWIGANELTGAEGRPPRLFKTTWENPTPEIEVRSLDFTTGSREGRPFLVALTAE